MSNATATTLGYPAGTRLVIFTCDDFGECHATNAAITQAMEAGLGIRKYAVGATIHMPGPWAPQAIEYARAHPQADVGVHLTMETGRDRPMKMRPLCAKQEVPGLHSPDGYFWDTGREAWAHASEDEIYREARAQLEAALAVGLDVTHIDGHAGFQGGNRAAFCRIVGSLASEFGLPARISPRWRYEELGLEAHRDEVRAKGVIASDDDADIASRKPDESWKAYYLRRLGEIRPGLTDLYIHPGVATEELRALLGEEQAAAKIDQYQLLVHDTEFGEAVKRAGVRPVTWREVRDFQRQHGRA